MNFRTVPRGMRWGSRRRAFILLGGLAISAAMALQSFFYPESSNPDPVVVAAWRSTPSTPAASTPSGRPPLEEQAGLQLFGAARSPGLMPVAPPPPPASAPVLEPSIPMLPGALRGVLRSPQGTARVLIEGADGQVRAVAAGEMIDAEWRLQTLDARQALVEHLPSRTQQSIALPAES